mmetsp:Transcript_5016/g.11677  ORF Transcript_5016/g.11677 Transcript_5016/m.11677 type:complete len:236 (-) Transcript_5016:117-824(-)
MLDIEASALKYRLVLRLRPRDAVVLLVDNPLAIENDVLLDANHASVRQSLPTSLQEVTEVIVWQVQEYPLCPDDVVLALFWVEFLQGGIDELLDTLVSDVLACSFKQPLIGFYKVNLLEMIQQQARRHPAYASATVQGRSKLWWARPLLDEVQKTRRLTKVGTTGLGITTEHAIDAGLARLPVVGCPGIPTAASILSAQLLLPHVTHVLVLLAIRVLPLGGLRAACHRAQGEPRE